MTYHGYAISSYLAFAEPLNGRGASRSVSATGTVVALEDTSAIPAPEGASSAFRTSRALWNRSRGAGRSILAMMSDLVSAGDYEWLAHRQ